MIFTQTKGFGFFVLSDSDLVIRRDISISASEGVKIPSNRKDYDLSWRREFSMSDVMYFAKCGAEVRADILSLKIFNVVLSVLDQQEYS